MKKITKLIGTLTMAALTGTLTLASAACALFPSNHTHRWGEWERTATGHSRTCTVKDCTAKEEGDHTGTPCEDCSYGFRILAFGFDSGGDTAHADFAAEANEWFPMQGEKLGFTYDFVGTDFTKLNDETLENYEMVIFLNCRPSADSQKEAFERFMRNGGAWMGFHACAFSMEGNNEHWTWYQDEFLGCGDYKNNTWNPTSEPLTVENFDHCATKNIEEDVFMSAPCEWYGWQSDLFANSDITVLLTLNPTTENPAGDQPDPNKQYEIWYDGCHPVAWVNNDYNMVYMNWGHNLQSYNNGAEGTSSKTFSSAVQNQFMLDAMYGLVENRNK